MKGFDIQAETSDNAPIIKSRNGLYEFEPEPTHILSSALKNNPMSGICFLSLISLLFHKRKSIDWWRYKHRIIALLFMGIFNSFLAFVEDCYLCYLFCFQKTRQVVKQATSNSELEESTPVFVLGHPRTGTTLLHSLLAFDEERFAICDTFMVGFPHCFLWFERLGKFLFAGILSETRPMDNMKLHFDLPQEDELGTNLLSGLRVSPYSSLVFMRDEREYRKYQCFLEGQVPDEDIKHWSRCFKMFLRKIRIRDGLTCLRSGQALPRFRQLLLKSPCHTGRVRLLLKLFPNAKFVFIHRNPYEVFLSGANMASTTYGWMHLQQPSDTDLQEYILTQGEILHNEYFSCREDVLNAKNSVEVSFEDLATDPKGSIRRIYTQFGFDSFNEDAQSPYPTRLDKECDELRGYKRNKFKNIALDDKLKETIKGRWHKQFEVLGYSKTYPSDRLL